MTDIEILNQLVNSMAEAVEKLEQAKQKTQAQDFDKIKLFILEIHRRIKTELGK